MNSKYTAEERAIAALPLVKLNDLSQFIAYLESTDDAEWCVDVVRNEHRNCCLGHLVNFAYGKGYEGLISPVWDFFENFYANSYMVYPVNDGENKKYQQDTPKARVIAYLKAMQAGDEPTIQQLEERDYQEWRESALADEDQCAVELLAVTMQGLPDD